MYVKYSRTIFYFVSLSLGWFSNHTDERFIEYAVPFILLLVMVTYIFFIKEHGNNNDDKLKRMSIIPILFSCFKKSYSHLIHEEFQQLGKFHHL